MTLGKIIIILAVGADLVLMLVGQIEIPIGVVAGAIGIGVLVPPTTPA